MTKIDKNIEENVYNQRGGYARYKRDFKKVCNDYEEKTNRGEQVKHHI